VCWVHGRSLLFMSTSAISSEKFHPPPPPALSPFGSKPPLPADKFYLLHWARPFPLRHVFSQRLQEPSSFFPTPFPQLDGIRSPSSFCHKNSLSPSPRRRRIPPLAGGATDKRHRLSPGWASPFPFPPPPVHLTRSPPHLFMTTS